ncbi:hypothetical protein CAPTEDRAFT_165072 [Capitella teleta]|uniref:Uncharacterized protein n=1 Tax=Capitella teleta TaxID=283909 RepID=R7TE02_CAPTE|nr:hypothetical protein CAPTEDRAFT_165072 [Capitella teleta]|eukprot:ELT91949.1 hypothetical protein CAPTEDRAFT_165072 [Capitella teleta]
MRFCWSVSYWTSPVLLTFLYHRGTFTYEGLLQLSSYGASFSVVIFLAIAVRAVGRVTNEDYRKFLVALYAAKKNPSRDAMRELRKYDSEVSAWPVAFKWNQASSKAETDSRRTFPASKSSSHRGTEIQGLSALPCQILGYLAVHTFGRRLMYPGATALINAVVGPALIQGRAKLVEEKDGIRAKVLTQEGNQIDTMVIDRRNDARYAHGDTLVVCCEGNAGFYEIGCPLIPLDAGYSVLGWNHPGFSGSSGQPLPSQEQNAIDAVMQYAIHQLGFPLQNIVLFAWSIGGYTATYAAMCYPDVKHVVLDATFDDVSPLAVARMPLRWKNLVLMAIRKHLNLNNAEQLLKYPGPILLIRRSKDEMITTIDASVIGSNRGNDLLIKLLQHRYPKVINDATMPYLREWVSKDKIHQALMLSKYNVDTDEAGLCESTIGSHVQEHSLSYPSMLGEDLDRDTRIQLTLFLASKYMDDYDSTHCAPLPSTFFRSPWQPSL